MMTGQPKADSSGAAGLVQQLLQLQAKRAQQYAHLHQGTLQPAFETLNVQAPHSVWLCAVYSTFQVAKCLCFASVHLDVQEIALTA